MHYTDVMYVSVTIHSQAVKVNTDHIQMLWPDECKFTVAGRDFILTTEAYDDLEAAIFPKRKKVSKENSELLSFFNDLHRLTGGKVDAILTPGRQKKLTELLKTFSKEQLITAATNIGNDKWLQGENDNNKRYGDIDYLLRPDKAAKWAEYKSEDKRRKLF